MTTPKLALACALLLSPAASAGSIYRYVEADGTIVYTNVRPKGAPGRAARSVEGTPRPAPAAQPQVSRRARELTTFDAHIEEAALRYKIPVALVWAVMHAESAFDPSAVSSAGAAGLMQLMPETAERMHVKDLFDAKENIEGGVRYLRVLANEFEGDMVKMVAAYNAGPEAVRRYDGQIPPFAETQSYVRKVLQLYFQYKARAEATGAETSGPGAAASEATQAHP